jgi:hypothetical protein
MSIKRIFKRIESIPNPDPELTPETWCLKQPCIKLTFFTKEIVISQPMSSFWVYLLGVMTTTLGVYFLLVHNGQKARFWWGISLVLWGLGAIIAGTSYQAFGYEIKGAGRNTCIWTSWWEILYLMFQQVSMNALLVAVSYSCTSGVFRQILIYYAGIFSLVYCLFVFIGGIIPVKKFITFELMVQVSTPIFLFFCILNTYRYILFSYPMDLVLIGVWIGLFLSLLSYWIYYKKGLGEKLWKKGIWFSENDVLHVTLIIWIVYIAIFVADKIRDY